MDIKDDQIFMIRDSKILQSERERLKSMLSGEYNLSDAQKIRHLTKTLQIVLDILDKILGE